MSDGHVLQEVGRYLRGLLFAGLRGNDDLGSKFSTVNSISLGSPAQLTDGDLSATSVLLSLYLYQIQPNEKDESCEQSEPRLILVVGRARRVGTVPVTGNIFVPVPPPRMGRGGGGRRWGARRTDWQ
jgi:hypothetical protein